ncbi:hypothetical protein, partial [Paenibacillus sp. MSJ-34]|uniref:hypothetical protein n=1 Tax=Paenibacillus sp. MSJ-34 TaxID=2841529 RepID=UPI001C122566
NRLTLYGGILFLFCDTDIIFVNPWTGNTVSFRALCFSVNNQVNQAIEEAKQKWRDEVLSPIVAERDELLQFKPQELTEEQKQIKQLKADLLQQKVVSALKDAELDDFIDFLNVENKEELHAKVDKLSTVLDGRKLNNSFIPQDHKQTDAYSQAEKTGNVQGMISAKLSKLFQ